jgi:hypothetical protein
VKASLLNCACARISQEPSPFSSRGANGQFENIVQSLPSGPIADPLTSPKLLITSAQPHNRGYGFHKVLCIDRVFLHSSSSPLAPIDGWIGITSGFVIEMDRAAGCLVGRVADGGQHLVAAA